MKSSILVFVFFLKIIGFVEIYAGIVENFRNMKKQEI
jgi:hypothetical protein